MNPTWFPWIGGGAAFLVLVMMWNSLVGKKNRVENAFASIDVMLKKRYDLIPNLVATVKQYASHEQETLTRVTELRSRVTQAPSGSDEALRLDNEISKALGGLMVSVERYPDLKADQGFRSLQGSLSEVEEQLSAARRAYNASVTEFNDAVEMFPTNMVAALLRYRRRPIFAAAEAERTNVDVAGLFKR